MGSEYREEEVQVGGVGVVTLRGGSGRPLLMLHDELGFPGWIEWTRQIATRRELVIPLQPGFGRTPRIDWIRDYRDLAAFYGRMVRDRVPALASEKTSPLVDDKCSHGTGLRPYVRAVESSGLIKKFMLAQGFKRSSA